MKSRLLEELKIGSMTVKNAVFMAPMSLGYESPDGTVNETMQEYWLARARGGVGCIIPMRFLSTRMCRIWEILCALEMKRALHPTAVLQTESMSTGQK